MGAGGGGGQRGGAAGGGGGGAGGGPPRRAGAAGGFEGSQVTAAERKADLEAGVLSPGDAAAHAARSSMALLEDGSTPLHAGCQEGHEECVELLLGAGASVVARNADGATPLLIACENGRTGCVSLLLGAAPAAAVRSVRWLGFWRTSLCAYCAVLERTCRTRRA